MPDEFTGVNDGSGPTDQGLSPNPEDQAHISTDNAAGATDQTGEGDRNQPGPVPYDRFREVNEGKIRAEETARRASAQVDQALQMLRNIQAPVRQPEPQDDIATDPTLQSIRAQFGDDAEGQRAFDAVLRISSTIAEKQTQKAVETALNRVQQETSGMVDARVGALTATMQTNATLQGWVDRGMIDANGLTEMTDRMRNAVTQDPRWGEAGNQPHLINQVYMGMLQEGKIKPGTYQRNPQGNNFPLRSGGRGGASRTQAQITASHEEELKAIQAKFPRSLGRVSMDTLKKMSPMDSRSAHYQQTDRGDVDTRILADTFVHTREEK